MPVAARETATVIPTLPTPTTNTRRQPCDLTRKVGVAGLGCLVRIAHPLPTPPARMGMESYYAAIVGGRLRRDPENVLGAEGSISVDESLALSWHDCLSQNRAPSLDTG